MLLNRCWARKRTAHCLRCLRLQPPPIHPPLHPAESAAESRRIAFLPFPLPVSGVDLLKMSCDDIVAQGCTPMQVGFGL